MDFSHWLYKLLTQALLPVPVAIGVLCLGLLLQRRYRRLSIVAISISLFTLIILSLPISARHLLHSLEKQHPVTAVEQAPQSDVILLLTGGVQPAELPRKQPELGARGDRVLTALRLLHSKKAPFVLIAGKNSATNSNIMNEAAATRQIMVEMGADADRIKILNRGNTTAETAEQLHKWMETEDLQRVLLVTSAYHMPRSMLNMRGLAPLVTPFTANHFIEVGNSITVQDWIPSASSLSGSTLAINEYLGIIVLRIRNRLALKSKTKSVGNF